MPVRSWSPSWPPLLLDRGQGPLQGALLLRIAAPVQPVGIRSGATWETKLDLQDIPPTPLTSTSDLLD